jgi:hypothetical protein
MKNKLAENMLRFGVKNLQESDIKKIEEVVLTEQTTFPTIESVWQDPRLKNIQLNASEMQQGITRESKYNDIIMENLVNYLGEGPQLIGKDAIGWPSTFNVTNGNLELSGTTGPLYRFKIQEIFKGKNHVIARQGGEWLPGEQDCIFITSNPMKVAGPYGNEGSLYVPSSDFKPNLTIEEYKTLGLPNVAHLRVIGNKVYYFKNVYGTPSGKLLSYTPLSNLNILSSLRMI